MARSRKQRKSRKTGKKSRRSSNPFMKALNGARSNNLEHFSYKGKTYKRKIAKTGMVLYKGV